MNHNRTPQAPTSERARQEKTAASNTRDGYGTPSRAAHISAKPDGDTGGGPGANNEALCKPAKPPR
jgi:hypothetical protein